MTPNPSIERTFQRPLCAHNPAVAVGRMFSGNFAEIAPASVACVVVAEIAGAALAVPVAKALAPR